ncbi:tRNA (N6-isopentenyl adenosine(37)-C2)-methylthiotransferase MiaB [bacterium]|nr:tRNA (N6-isopentenyl adenosine(37)-C2)-methylthiotransferase MiaB [bacterium]
MNEYDSAAVANILNEAGWHRSKIEDADIIIVNTCAVRQNAEDRAMGRLLTIAGTYPKKTVGIMGCVAKEKGKEILQRNKHIDFAVGPGEIDRILEIAESEKKESILLEADRLDGCGLRAEIPQNSLKAFVAITRGCENFCSYCIVPYVRGHFRSRPHGDIIDEIKRDIDLGIKEITLLGQNVNSYLDTSSNQDFADLLYKIHRIDGLLRIRFVTNHPKDMSDKIIDAIASLPKVCQSIHLPVQSGSTKVLSAMNRGYTREKYLQLIDKIKDKIPDVALSTDIIAGFPGETDSDFEETITLYKSVAYAGSFAFRYSPRPGTKAAGIPDDVPEKMKIQRLKRIIDLGQELAEKYSKMQVGRIKEVMVEELVNKGIRQCLGFDRSGRRVVFADEGCSLGDILKVKVISAKRWLLFGEAINGDS